jgi:hypothetical protein
LKKMGHDPLNKPPLAVQEHLRNRNDTGEVMTQDEFVNDVLAQAKHHWAAYWGCLADDQRLRLAGMEAELRSITQKISHGLWTWVATALNGFAIEQEGQCKCGRRRERRNDTVSVTVLGEDIDFRCTYLYCRHCRQGSNPVRQWLGLESGGVSIDAQRALTDFTTRMTFGDAVHSMQEHHGQTIERTKVERITYQVADEATEYLQEQRHRAREGIRSGETAEVDQLVFTADGGAIPVGKLSRPSESNTHMPKTKIRKLPKGTRTITGREARFISAHGTADDAKRVVDCHIAPYETPRYTGERMFAAACAAGLGDHSRIHGVFDMGKWIHSQFEEQFAAYESSVCRHHARGALPHRRRSRNRGSVSGRGVGHET